MFSILFFPFSLIDSLPHSLTSAFLCFVPTFENVFNYCSLFDFVKIWTYVMAGGLGVFLKYDDDDDDNLFKTKFKSWKFDEQKHFLGKFEKKKHYD